MPIMSIYHLPLGQYGHTGHVINLPQDVVSFALSLPRLPSELDVLIVRKNSEQSHRDFRVRRSVVQQALTWLFNNNRYYTALMQYTSMNRLYSSCRKMGTCQTSHHFRRVILSLSHRKMIYMEPTCQHRLFLMLHSKGQNKRQSRNLFKTCRVAHTPSHGPPLEEHPSMSLPQRATSAWPSPPCSPLEPLTSWDSAATRSPSATTSPTSRSTEMAVLPDTLASGSLP